MSSVRDRPEDRDRVLTADVVFTGQPFANDEEAKAWYWGTEGQALKALLMSFSYR